MDVRIQGVPPNTVLMPKLICHALKCDSAWTLMRCVQIQQVTKKAMPVEKTRREKKRNVTMMMTVKTHIFTSFTNVTLFGRHFDALSVFWLLFVYKCKSDCYYK